MILYNEIVSIKKDGIVKSMIKVKENKKLEKNYSAKVKLYLINCYSNDFEMTNKKIGLKRTLQRRKFVKKNIVKGERNEYFFKKNKRNGFDSYYNL